MERTLIKYCGQKIGYQHETIDGMFCPGGSMANMYGMALARHHYFPDTKVKGVKHLGEIVMFASEDVRY